MQERGEMFSSYAHNLVVGIPIYLHTVCRRSAAGPRGRSRTLGGSPRPMRCRDRRGQRRRGGTASEGHALRRWVLSGGFVLWGTVIAGKIVSKG